MRLRKNNTLAVFLFTFPTLAMFTVFVIYPIMQILYRSVFEWDGITKGKFVYFDNFIRLFSDPNFYLSFTNGIIAAVFLTVIQLFVATVLALTMLEKKIFARNLLRKSYFIPVLISVTIVCQLWSTMYNPEYGLFNKLFEALGLAFRQEWLSSLGRSSIIAVVTTTAWNFIGSQFILIYTGAKSIPEHYFEAAKIEGASKFTTHMKVTIPLLAETYKICLIFTVTGGLNIFAHIQLMTNGGPGTATYTLPFLMYRSAFIVNEFGYGSAVALIIIIQSLLVTLLINKCIAREQITY